MSEFDDVANMSVKRFRALRNGARADAKEERRQERLNVAVAEAVKGVQPVATPTPALAAPLTPPTTESDLAKLAELRSFAPIHADRARVYAAEHADAIGRAQQYEAARDREAVRQFQQCGAREREAQLREASAAGQAAQQREQARVAALEQLPAEVRDAYLTYEKLKSEGKTIAAGAHRQFAGAAIDQARAAIANAQKGA